MTTHCLSYRFFRKFDILNRAKITDIYVNIMYKQKFQKINSINVEITDESKLRINFK